MHLARFALFVMVFALLPAGPQASGQAGGILFRYLPGQPELSSAVTAEDVEAGPFLDPRELVARSPGGWGMSAPSSGEYEAPGSVLRSTGARNRIQPLGPRITAEIWIQSQLSSQTSTLVTNQVSGSEGFTLGLDADRPYLQFVYADETYRIETATTVEESSNAWIAGTVSYFNQVLTLRLFINGVEMSFGTFPKDIPSPYVIAAPFMVGSTAAGAAVEPTLKGTFTGQVFAATVREYIPDERYLTSGVPLDGGPYFGLPDYHDYSLNDFHIPMDLRMQAEQVAIKHRYFLPYANDEYIPQGVATNVERTDGEDVPLVYVAYYHRTRDNKLETQHTIIVELDSRTGHVRRTFRLMGDLAYSHAGGIAFSHGALYVSSVGTLEAYPVPVYAGPHESRYVDLQADPQRSVRVPAKASYVSAHRDTLWVGDWRTSSDVAPFLYAHALDADGVPDSEPARVFAVPRNIQGVDVFDYRGESWVVLSRNKSSSAAELLKYRLSSLQRHVVATPDSSITMPHGIEDLSFFPDGTLWTNSESGTDYYQRKTNPWTSFYPFVYSVPAQVVFGAGATSLGHEPVGGPQPSGVQLDVYPNPFRGRASIRLTSERSRQVDVYLVDMLGRRVHTVLQGHVSAGTTTFRVEGHDLPPGQFFAVVEDEGRRTVRAMAHTR
ncbi:MAG: hypothetical protein ACI9W4_002456 [Rhodothermales bacterium]|jgi:hypothetical protein